VGVPAAVGVTLQTDAPLGVFVQVRVPVTLILAVQTTHRTPPGTSLYGRRSAPAATPEIYSVTTLSGLASIDSAECQTLVQDCLDPPGEGPLAFDQ
jgi:hypothetical protein